MRMIHIDSSNLRSVGYENGNLYITFSSSSTYCYFNVPEAIYRGLLAADSKGRYHADFIKNSYSYRRIG